MSSQIRYARSGDVNIAYQVTGDGPFDLVLVQGLLLPPRDRLGERGVRSLPRATRVVRPADLLRQAGDGALRQGRRPPRLRDAHGRRARRHGRGRKRVCGAPRLLGRRPAGVLFATSYPERTRSLVLYGTYAKRCDPDDDYPWAPTRGQRADVAAELERTWGENMDLTTMAPNADAALRAWFERRGRAGLSPAGARDLILMNSKADVRELLPSVSCPTLVLHRTGDLDVARRGRPLHRRAHPGRAVRRARGRRPLRRRRRRPDPRRGRGVPHRDAARARLAPRPHHDSLHRPRRLDGARPGSRRRALDRAARRAPRRRCAVRSAASPARSSTPPATASSPPSTGRHGRSGARSRSGDALEPLGLHVRAGVHTGEVERRPGEKPRGIAVHVASRIASLAAGDEVLVSSTTHDLVAGSGLAFDDRGEHALKGIEGLRRVYAAR